MCLITLLLPRSSRELTRCSLVCCISDAQYAMYWTSLSIYLSIRLHNPRVELLINNVRFILVSAFGNLYLTLCSLYQLLGACIDSLFFFDNNVVINIIVQYASFDRSNHSVCVDSFREATKKVVILICTKK